MAPWTARIGTNNELQLIESKILIMFMGHMKTEISGEYKLIMNLNLQEM